MISNFLAMLPLVQQFNNNDNNNNNNIFIKIDTYKQTCKFTNIKH